MKGPLVSIVIVNYNGKELLKIALDSIKKSEFKNFEIIVVDNSSTDGSQDFLKKNYPKIVLVGNKANLGYSGINSAMEYCKGKFIFFLNNDIKIDAKCIPNLLKVIQSDNSIGMTAPKLINYYDKELISGGTWLSKAFYNGHVKGDKNKENLVIPYLGVGLIRKSIVEHYGFLFDPDYFIYAEDVDLGLRIRLMHKKIVFVNDAILYHMHAATMSKSSKSFTTFLMERNLLVTFFKTLSLKNIILYVPYVLSARFLAIIKDLTTLRINLAFSRLKAIFYIFTNFKLILRKRRQTQKLRKADDIYLFQVFSESHLLKPKFIV